MKDLKRIIHTLVHIPNTDDTKYDKYGRISDVKKNGVWNLKNYKDLKNSTPDGDTKNIKNLPSYCKGDIVNVLVDKCLYNHDISGNYYFDSYDKWDNTCFISKNDDGLMCINVLLSDIVLIDRNDTIKIMILNAKKNIQKEK